ncbi:MAG: prolyl-tRNA synthetase, partial [Parcubacteria group bacterium Gr01-1014_66]
IREEMNATGAQELLLSALHPLENYIKTGRDKIDILFHTELAAGTKLVLGQSHEEIVVPLARKFIASWRDLPLALYQIQTKFRNELRAKSGILRGREFIMKDCYSFHTDEEDFEAYYEQQKHAYRRIFERVGLGEKTFLTVASGGTFSKYSHEFQTLTDVGEDTIYICEKCSLAINKEIRQEHAVCPECGKDSFREETAIEVGNIFPLKTRFSDAFGLTFKNQAGKEKPVIMGCYGIGLGRLMGTIVELYHDTHGIRWHDAVAPFSVHLIELLPQAGETGGQVKKAAEKCYRELVAKGIEVLYDDRDKSAGEKFADADLIGIPWRIVISTQTISKKKWEVKRRDTTRVEFLTTTSLLKLLEKGKN